MSWRAPGSTRTGWAALRRRSAADALDQLARAAADEDLAQPPFDGSADGHAEHPPGVAFQPVGHARAAAAQVLELPGADERLQVALLLVPLDQGGLLVREAQPVPHGLDLGVALGVRDENAALVIALEHLDVLEPVLPVRRRLDVDDDVPDLVDRHVDLGRRHASQLAHGGSLCPYVR